MRISQLLLAVLYVIKLIRIQAQELARCACAQFCICRGAAVLLSALMLAWPAFYNGFPLLYPDSMTYLDDGRLVARSLFLHRFSDYYGVRSLLYSLVILPLHWNLTPWPVVALQCLLVAWVIWLVVRSLVARGVVAKYLALMLFVSLLTSASWYASFIMPDVLGGVAYFAIYLIVFARETLASGERWVLYCIAVWCVTAHATHLLLAGGLCALLALVAVALRKRFAGGLHRVGEAAMIVAVAAMAQMALDGYLYGKPTLNGESPPYLTARIIADGAGHRYLDAHCAEVRWAVCDHLGQLNDDQDDFLWGENGVYETASESEQVRIRREEMPFVLAVLRAYPREEFSRAMSNFVGQLQAFGLYGFDANDWMLEQFDAVMPRARASYLKSRQAHDALPLDLLTRVQWWTIVASLAGLVVLAPLLWRFKNARLAGLVAIVAASVIANALITGVLSVVDDRYGCRVIWMITLLAGICFLVWMEQRKNKNNSDVLLMSE